MYSHECRYEWLIDRLVNRTAMLNITQMRRDGMNNDWLIDLQHCLSSLMIMDSQGVIKWESMNECRYERNEWSIDLQNCSSTLMILRLLDIQYCWSAALIHSTWVQYCDEWEWMPGIASLLIYTSTRINPLWKEINQWMQVWMIDWLIGKKDGNAQHYSNAKRWNE